MDRKSILFGFCLVALAASAAAQTVTGSGTTNSVPVFTGTSTVGNSPISISGSNVGIGTTSPTSNLQVGNGSGNESIYVYGNNVCPPYDNCGGSSTFYDGTTYSSFGNINPIVGGPAGTNETYIQSRGGEFAWDPSVGRLILP